MIAVCAVVNKKRKELKKLFAIPSYAEHMPTIMRIGNDF